MLTKAMVDGRKQQARLAEVQTGRSREELGLVLPTSAKDAGRDGGRSEAWRTPKSPSQPRLDMEEGG